MSRHLTQAITWTSPSSLHRFIKIRIEGGWVTLIAEEREIQAARQTSQQPVVPAKVKP